MDENTKKIQTEIAKDKIQIILSSIALAVLIIMEFYIMINFKSNFMAMAVGILLMIVALFFLISAILDMSLKQKNMEQEKYEEIYNAQKASYLVIKKSFDEMEQRLRVIEQNSSLPAEDIINAQKAVAKVTISRSKENTDALMNSNDELINQLVNIQEKLENNNSQIIEKQQSIIKESNFDIQQKIAALTSQISNIEGRIQSGIPVMAQPVQMTPPPVVQEAPVAEESFTEELPVMDELSPVDEMPAMEELPSVDEMPAMEELPPTEEMPAMEEIPQEEVISTEDVAMEEATSDDLGLDLDAAVEESAEEEIGLDLDAVMEEETEEVVDDLGLNLDDVVEEAPADELPVMDEMPAMEEIPEEEPVVEEQVEERPAVEKSVEEQTEEIPVEAPAEEIIAEAEPEIEPEAEEELGANLDALLEEIGETVEEEEPEPEPEAPAEPEPAEEDSDSIVIPDVGVDLTDPNRVMSPEEIEKLFASI